MRYDARQFVARIRRQSQRRIIFTMRPALLIIATFATALCASATAHRAAAQSADPTAFIAGQTKDCPGCNLAGVSLKRRNLAGANLAGANLAGASFHRAVLRGANLSGADLTGA